MHIDRRLTISTQSILIRVWTSGRNGDDWINKTVKFKDHGYNMHKTLVAAREIRDRIESEYDLTPHPSNPILYSDWSRWASKNLDKGYLNRANGAIIAFTHYPELTKSFHAADYNSSIQAAYRAAIEYRDSDLVQKRLQKKLQESRKSNAESHRGHRRGYVSLVESRGRVYYEITFYDLEGILQRIQLSSLQFSLEEAERIEKLLREDPTLYDALPRCDMYMITEDSKSQTYYVTHRTKEKLKRKSFAFKKCGGRDKALQLAKAYRDSVFEEHASIAPVRNRKNYRALLGKVAS